MKYVITLVLGIILGSGGAVYLLGTPRAHALPGTAVQAPPQGGDAPGTAVIALDDKFFDQVLGSIFRDLGSPSFQLSAINRKVPMNIANVCECMRSWFTSQSRRNIAGRITNRSRLLERWLRNSADQRLLRTSVHL